MNLAGPRQALRSAQERLGDATSDARYKIAVSERAAGAEADRIRAIDA